MAFGFAKEAAKKAGKKMYGFVENHPIAATAGIMGGAYGLAKATGYDKSIGQHHAIEFLENNPDLKQAFVNQAAIMMHSESAGAQASPNSENMQIIRKSIAKEPEQMNNVLMSFEDSFRNHILELLDKGNK